MHVPQRHSWFPLLDNEQIHVYMRDWQKPFTVTWKRLEPAIKYLLEVPHDFCQKIVPQNLKPAKTAGSFVCITEMSVL